LWLRAALCRFLWRPESGRLDNHLVVQC
jgi:hypothetical protein